MTTDTPRTYAAEPQLYSNAGGWVKADFARELERELARANKEIEFYEEIGQQKVDELRASQADVEFWKTKAYEAEEMEGKHEAEVERLKKLTEDCLSVIRVYCPTYYNDAMERFNIATK